MGRFEFGVGKIKILEKILDSEKPKNILILRGQKSYKYYSKKLLKLIKHNYCSFIVKESNISLDLMNKGIQFYKGMSCDLIISIGGGSVIDMGKLISIFSTNNQKPLNYISGHEKYIDKKNTLIAIPTTSGSGSEATHFAVLYNEITKYSVAHKSLLPDYSIIDPELTYSLPSYQTAVSAMDALCQAIESFWSLNSTIESREYSRKAIELIMDNIESVVLNPDDFSRNNMSLGSHYAGRAINIAKTTAAHAFSYPLTKLFDIPHGHAVSLSIGQFYNFNSQMSDYEGSKDLMTDLNKLLKVKDGYGAEKKLKSLMETIGLFSKLPAKIFFDENVSKVVENINIERLKNNPAKVRKSDLVNIFKSICS